MPGQQGLNGCLFLIGQSVCAIRHKAVAGNIWDERTVRDFFADDAYLL